MHRWPLTFVLVVAACAPTARDVKSTLSATDAGTIAFRSGDLVLSGDLRFPSPDGRVAAVVLMHGCSGLPHRAISSWEPLLRSWGYATFVVDSFSARGHREVCTTAAVQALQRVPDAYGALAMVALHPRIDPQRIVLMGLSHGGLVAVVSSTDWAEQRYGGNSSARFRGVLAFYPYCNSEIATRPRVAVPLRIHTGELDDWTPAAPCVRRVEAARTAREDVSITVYKDAHHAFDAVGGSVSYLRNVLNAAACTPRLATIDGPVLNRQEMAACVRRGATSGWYDVAAEQARVNVRRELSELLK